MARRKINFSVVIPVYNKADTIVRAIRSVLSQAYSAHEIICVDDGSTDGSTEILDSYLQLQHPTTTIKVIHQENAGVSAARNKGAEVAEGEYIALLDADDVWFPNHLEQIAELIENHPEIKFFGSGYEREGGNWVYYTIPWPWTSVVEVPNAFKYAQRVHTSTVVIERALWLELSGFDSRYSFYEDYEFFFRLGLKTNIGIAPKPGARYTDDAASKITAKKYAVCADKWPHLKLIDEMIAAGEAPRSYIDYAGRTVALMRDEVCGIFPHIKKRAISKILNRIMNHTYIWRKRR